MTNISESELNKKLKQDFEHALNQSVSIVIINHEGIIKQVNNNYCQLSQYTRNELINQPFQILTTDEPPQISLTNTIALNQVDSIWQKELKKQKKDGTVYWVEAKMIPFSNEASNKQYIVLQRDITKRKEYEQAIKKMAYSDPLTKLPNRNKMKKWAAEHAQNKDTELTILFVDIDRFKVINDNFGHSIGDKVLITISERLKNCLDSNGLIFRLTGEKFTIITENKTREQVQELINKVSEAIREPIQINDLQLLLTASIGISSGYPRPKEADFLEVIEDLINKADTAMLHAKRQGGNQYYRNTVNQTIEIERNYLIELEIRNALERNEFSLVYQPLINLKTNKIVGVESLLRWNNRELGSVSPGEFIPVLEDTGAITVVGKWILKTVCEQMKNWQVQGLFLQRITVNVSPVQFRDPDFVTGLNEILNQTQLDASYLEIEITEGTLIDIKDSAKKLHDLQELGVKVSIDDFGTGYSSLSYLKKLPIDTLKIDKSFIDDLDRDGEIIVNTIISMGKNLQFRVIAEGIENMDQFKYLQQQECHEGQGYFFSRPVESNKIEEIYYSLQ